MRRIWTVLIAAGALLCAAPTAATAAETIGANVDGLTAGSTVNDVEGNGERSVLAPSLEASFQASGGLTADAPGVITSFRVKYGNALVLTPRLALRVVRAVDMNTFFVGPSSDPVDVATNTTLTYPTRLPIAAGEGLGVDMVPGMASQVATFFHVPAAAGSRSRTGGAGAADGPFPLNTEGDYPAVSNAFPLVDATVEPDADGDGFGDESQDLCPTDVGVQSACPAAAPVAENPCRSIKKKKARKRCVCRQKEGKARKKCLRKLKDKSGRKKSGRRG